jgi:hypothetical protein
VASAGAADLDHGFPVVCLVILGNAMNRPLQRCRPSWTKPAMRTRRVPAGVLAIQTGRRLVTAEFVTDRARALDGLRRGRYRGVWVLPFGLSPSGPAPSFIGDNTDRFSFDALEQTLGLIWAEVSAPKNARPPAPAVRLGVPVSRTT